MPCSPRQASLQTRRHTEDVLAQENGALLSCRRVFPYYIMESIFKFLRCYFIISFIFLRNASSVPKGIFAPAAFSCPPPEPPTAPEACSASLFNAMPGSLARMVM